VRYRTLRERLTNHILVALLVAILTLVTLPCAAEAIGCPGCTRDYFDYISRGEPQSFICLPDYCWGEKWLETVHFKQIAAGAAAPGNTIEVVYRYWVYDCRMCPRGDWWIEDEEYREIELCWTCADP